MSSGGDTLGQLSLEGEYDCLWIDALILDPIL